MTPACCPEWTRAQQEETDNEGYGALLYFRDDENAEFGYPVGWIMGNDSLKPVRFCPWCGAAVLPRADNGPVEGT